MKELSMSKLNRGYTSFEMFFAFIFILSIVLIAFALYAVVHFVQKFW